MRRVLYNLLLVFSTFVSRLIGRGSLQGMRVKRILVVELTKLGDLVSNLPLFPALKDFFPRASIAVMVQENHASLYSLIPEVDEILTCKRSSRLGDFWRSVHEIRRQKFDLVISPSPSARQGVFVLLSGARYKFGYLDYNRAKVLHLQSHRIRSLGFRTHSPSRHAVRMDSFGVTNITERVTRLCENLGAKKPDSKPVLHFLREDLARQTEVKERIALTDGTSYIVIHPFAGWRYRAWGIENCRTLACRILESFPHHVLIIGGHGDRSSIQPLLEEFAGQQRVAFAIGLPLDKLAAVLAGAALFIGSDSGPLHLAAAAGTPSIGIFGPVPPEVTGPPVAMNSYLYKKVECSPCDQLDCVRKWAPCITLISVEEVFQKLREALVVGDGPPLRKVPWPRTA